VPLRVVEQTAHDPYRLGERLSVSVIEPRQVLIDRGAAVGMNLSQHRVALGCDVDPDGPGVGGIGRPSHQVSHRGGGQRRYRERG
jgi:hypothetical protein